MDHAHAASTAPPAGHGDPHAAPHAGAHAPDHGAGHGAGHHGGLSYAAVFWILLIVTVAEVGVAYLDIANWLKILTFVAMALYKALMVAFYFMHLKYEKKGMWLVAAAPMIFGPIIALGAFPDSEKGHRAFKRGELIPWTAPMNPAPHGTPAGGPEKPEGH